MFVCRATINKELQRYPRLHARLIEVVSDLLRERLGPTTEYVQSLIDIQTAYINTNHPAFRAGTQEYARQKAQQQGITNKSRGALEGKRFPDGHLEEMNETAASSSQEDDSEQGYPVLGNGRPASTKPGQHGSTNPAVEREMQKIRSASHSTHDRHPSMSASAVGGGANSINNALYGTSSQHAQSRSTSSSVSHLYPAPTATAAGPATSAPKDSFLNYFFGGVSVSGGSLMDPASGRQSRTNLPEFGSTSSNPLLGRKGHEGVAAAYDMKSLDRHLDAVGRIGCLCSVCSLPRSAEWRRHS